MSGSRLCDKSLSSLEEGNDPRTLKCAQQKNRMRRPKSERANSQAIAISFNATQKCSLQRDEIAFHPWCPHKTRKMLRQDHLPRINICHLYRLPVRRALPASLFLQCQSHLWIKNQAPQQLDLQVYTLPPPLPPLRASHLI